MRRRLVRIVATGAAAVAMVIVPLTLGLGGGVAQALPQGPVGDCVSGDRVWLVAVTDGGAVRASTCVGQPGSGLQALAQVGYSNHPSAGYVCTVAGYPAACPTQFANQYWSYWYASPGGSWTYSNVGPGDRRPPAGSLEGWCYTVNASGATQQSTCRAQLTGVVNPAAVSVAPPPPPPTTTAPKPTTAAPKPTTAAPKPTSTRPTTTRPTTTKPTSAKPTRATTSKAPASSPTTAVRQTSTAQTTTPVTSPPARTTASSAVASSSAPASSGPAATAPSIAPPSTASSSPSGEPVTATVSSSGSPVGLVATAGLVALGAGGTGIYLWKRPKP